AVSIAGMGRIDAARAVVTDESTGRLMAVSPDFTSVVTTCVLAEAVRAIGDVSWAARVYDDLSPFRGQVGVISSGITSMGSVDLFLGSLAITLSWPEIAARHLRTAV